MKHALLLLILALLGYAAWHVSTRKTRKTAVAMTAKHGWRIALIFAVIFTLLLLAASINAPSII